MEPVGSGPYQLGEHQIGVRYVYERNPTYWEAEEGRPYIEERLVLPLDDSSALEAASRGEQTHVWTPPADTADRLETDLGDHLEVVEALGLNLVTWNMSSARDHFGDERVREAIYRAFNYEEYVDLTVAGWGEYTPGQLPNGHERFLVDASETDEYKRHDVEEARQLLEAAGFDSNQTYEITTITGAINESNVQVFQQQMRQAGIGTSINSLAGGEWLETKTTTGDYDFCVVGHPDYDSPQTPLRLHHTEARNVNAWMNIRDPEIDAMIEESEQELDPAAHEDLVKRIQIELLRRYSNLSYVYTPIVREMRYDYLMDWETNLAAQPMYPTEAWLDL